MNIKFFVFIVVLFVSCKETREKNRVSLKTNTIRNTGQNTVAETNDESKPEKDSTIIEVGYYENLEKLPHFVLDSIEEAEYNTIAKNKSFEIAKIERHNDFFYIQGAHQKFEFKKYKDYKGDLSWSGYEYMGSNAVLSLTALCEFSTADYMGFSEMRLLDTSNDFQYKLISLGDSSVSVPVLSPDNQFMVYFQNPEYESKDLTLVILKVNDKKNPAGFLTEYKSCFSKSENSIEEVKWKSNTVIYIKAFNSVGFDQYGKEQKEYFYYKAEL